MKTRAALLSLPPNRSALTRTIAIAVAGLLAASLGACSSSANHANARVSGSGQLGADSARSAPEATLNEVATLLTGTFTSDAQAQANPDFYPIALHMAPIWTRFSGSTSTARAGERWFYVEQAVATAPEKPYRQRVYRVTPLVYTDVAGVTQVGVRSEVWELPGDPLRYAGAWQSPDPLADIGPESLALKDGCEVVLFRGPDGVWRGSTVGDSCVSTRQGASYVTSLVEVSPKGLKTLDRGFDAKGAQVWGSEHGAYVFDRVSR